MDSGPDVRRLHSLASGNFSARVRLIQEVTPTGPKQFYWRRVSGTFVRRYAMLINRRTWPCWPATGLFLATLLGAPPAVAQPPRDTTRIPSPVLLKRLAEAVDGHRTGAVLYVVASYQPPHHVLAVLESRADAESQARAAGGLVDVFGPYKSQRDPVREILMKCVHYNSAADPVYCPDRSPIPLGDVDTLSITVRLKNREVRTFPLPRGTDVVFFTLSAVDKFMIPYYTRVLGVEEAARMRQDIVRRLPQR
jgi:hypothetical protein